MIKRIRCIYIISVSKKINDLLLSRSINSIFMNAYVPIAHNKINLDKNVAYIYLGMNMWKFNREQIDRYGTDIVFKLLADYPEKYKFDIYVSNRDNSTDLGSIVNILGIQESITKDINVFFGRNLIEYIGNYDIFLRPNRSDAFGVSILEALDAGIPVLASDTCIRPEGCYLFESGNYESFRRKIISIEDRRTIARMVEKNNNHLKLVELYKENIRNYETDNSEL
jgi:glycosyltransferase involved in cell wall biosynthesis